MLRSANASRSLAAATLPDTEVSAAASNSLLQLGQSLFGRGDAGGEFDVLLGQPVEPGRGVDHQIPQLLERLGLRLQFAVGARRRHTTRVSSSRRCAGVSGGAVSQVADAR